MSQVPTSSPDSPVVSVRGLHHTYGTRTALQGIDFTVSSGEIFGLLGPNGSGKTTTFRILSTALAPTAGSVRIFGTDIGHNPDAIRHRIGVVFQYPSLDSKLTVCENLRHQGHLYGMYGRNLRSRSEAMLKRVGLIERADDLVENLSGGLRRRVELAKALLHGPDLLLLDEPSTGLDPGARRDLWEYLKNLCRRQGITLLFTTHLMDEAEACDRVGILHQGAFVALGSPQTLKETIGGDVITIQTPAAAHLATQLEDRLGCQTIMLDNRTLRIEYHQGHRFVAKLVDAFSDQIIAVTLGKPTLEDVFIQRTGHRFWDQQQEELRA